jgi:hypothetical protein
MEDWSATVVVRWVCQLFADECANAAHDDLHEMAAPLLRAFEAEEIDGEELCLCTAARLQKMLTRAGLAPTQAVAVATVVERRRDTDLAAQACFAQSDSKAGLAEAHATIVALQSSLEDECRQRRAAEVQEEVMAELLGPLVALVSRTVRATAVECANRLRACACVR